MATYSSVPASPTQSTSALSPIFRAQSSPPPVEHSVGASDTRSQSTQPSQAAAAVARRVEEEAAVEAEGGGLARGSSDSDLVRAEQQALLQQAQQAAAAEAEAKAASLAHAACAAAPAPPAPSASRATAPSVLKQAASVTPSPAAALQMARRRHHTHRRTPSNVASPSAPPAPAPTALTAGLSAASTVTVLPLRRMGPQREAVREHPHPPALPGPARPEVRFGVAAGPPLYPTAPAAYSRLPPLLSAALPPPTAVPPAPVPAVPAQLRPAGAGAAVAAAAVFAPALAPGRRLASPMPAGRATAASAATQADSGTQGVRQRSCVISFGSLSRASVEIECEACGGRGAAAAMLQVARENHRLLLQLLQGAACWRGGRTASGSPRAVHCSLAADSTATTTAAAAAG